ncbi:MAG: hypothetical protein U0P30_06550 [Vicinamibacterales bacterium]
MLLVVEKSYLDVVTADGVAVVAYVVDVGWLGLDLRLSARLRVVPGNGPDERSALGDAATPVMQDGALTWASSSLDVQGVWRALDPPVAATLLDTPAGRIEWSCRVPRARAVVVVDGVRHEGLGYAEHLRLTVPPWALPFHTLRWGRHLSDRHALVWIEWDGDAPLRMAWLDGAAQASARVDRDGLAGLDGGRSLRWRPGHDLTHRRVGAAIGRAAPVLGARIGGRLASMQEHKQCARSSLIDAGGHVLDDGWAIHEVVTW